MLFDVNVLVRVYGKVTLPLIFATQTNSKAGLCKEYLNIFIYKFDLTFLCYLVTLNQN